MHLKSDVLSAAFALLVAAAPAAAHHSFSVEYDESKPVSLSGVVTRVEWTNPHARVYVDAPDASGEVHTWNLELASPSALARNGWSSRTLKAGDAVRVDGYEGRAEHTYRLNARSIVLPDGRSLFSGSADDPR